MTELIKTTSQTPIEVLLKIDENGYTTAKNLYNFLELNPTHYARWCNKNILENPYADKDVEYFPFTINGECGGQATTDYKITSDFAKKLSMTSNSKRGEQARDYFIAVEKKLKEKVENENKRINAIVSIVNSKNDIEMALAIKNYGEIIEQPLLETIDKQKPMVELAELRISALGCYTITDVNKTFGFKKGRLTKYAKANGLIHKKNIEVNKKGEKLFKVYSKNGEHNQIGITEEGLQWVKENKDIIANYKD